MVTVARQPISRNVGMTLNARGHGVCMRLCRPSNDCVRCMTSAAAMRMTLMPIL
jgi:hypothetical protein